MRKVIISVVTIATLLVGSATAAAQSSMYQPPDNTSQAGTSANSPNHSSTMSSPPQSNNARVTIQNMMFTPADMTVQLGSTVTWSNQDNVSHTVTSDNSGSDMNFNSGALTPGQQFSNTFNMTGVYSYHCSIHPYMTGVIRVVKQSQQPPAPYNQHATKPPTYSSQPPASAQANASATVNNYNSYGYYAAQKAPPGGYNPGPSANIPHPSPPNVAYSPQAATTTAQPLPNTGPEGTIALAAASTFLGTASYYMYLFKRKKLS